MKRGAKWAEGRRQQFQAMSRLKRFRSYNSAHPESQPVTSTINTGMFSYPGRDMSAGDRALVEAFEAKQREQAA